MAYGEDLTLQTRLLSGFEQYIYVTFFSFLEKYMKPSFWEKTASAVELSPQSSLKPITGKHVWVVTV